LGGEGEATETGEAGIGGEDGTFVSAVVAREGNDVVDSVWTTMECDVELM